MFSWLKTVAKNAVKAATIAGKTVTIAQGIEAATVKAFPGLENIPALQKTDHVFEQMQNAVLFAEIVGLTNGTTFDRKTLTGAERMELARKGITGLVEAAEKAAGHPCARPDMQREAIALYAQATVLLLNSREPVAEIPDPPPVEEKPAEDAASGS